ncbi:hypothetical protein PR202_ga15002 [Eleusine coracana subsp. coracana]|uniref:SPX domain-containing protein n=1 Tax=Eleusine coracana subsp. coracana TaxID=191504 RepID=A0AAV5CI70_ELECO|nr:hypothetical protein PR202_ga15002 [Eleusine coracana subsp. coracana]
MRGDRGSNPGPVGYRRFYLPRDEAVPMKFGKSLSGQIVETLPEWRDKFLSYKDLKKRLKLIGAGGGGGEDGAERQPKRAPPRGQRRGA